MTNQTPLGSPVEKGAVDLGAKAPARPVAAPAGAPGAVRPPQGEPAGGPEVPGDLIIDVTQDTFKDMVELSTQVPVILDLWASWCGPCKQLTPVLEELTAEFKGRFQLAKCDIDANPEVAQAFQVKSVPTVFALLGGRPLELFQGAVPKAEIRDVLNQLLELAEQTGVTGVLVGDDGSAAAPPLPPLHQEALDLLDEGDVAGSIAIWEKAIKQDPRDHGAKQGLAQARLVQRMAEPEADPVLQGADAAITDEGDAAKAFGLLLDDFAVADGDRRKLVRERLLELFDLVGNSDPAVVTARQKMAAMLF